jgi:hypothetical protein
MAFLPSFKGEVRAQRVVSRVMRRCSSVWSVRRTRCLQYADDRNHAGILMSENMAVIDKIAA